MCGGKGRKGDEDLMLWRRELLDGRGRLALFVLEAWVSIIVMLGGGVCVLPSDQLNNAEINCNT